jgi:hypothetical protein
MKRPMIDHNTALAIVGLAALAVGLALVYLPVAFIVTGALFIVYAILPDQTPGGPS